MFMNGRPHLGTWGKKHINLSDVQNSNRKQKSDLGRYQEKELNETSIRIYGKFNMMKHVGMIGFLFGPHFQFSNLKIMKNDSRNSTTWGKLF